ncbi:MAG: oligoendopeptidase F family protein, partial [Candidatus Aminicenantes bacterium]|nr:oligoendopeptidase F family protein [Candidatus Aminicenantes bacterium]
VMRTYWEHHSRFENTQAILLDAEIKKHLFHTRVHHYKDCLEAALYPRKIDAQVYYTLIAAVKENLAPLHRYLGLKARLLDIDRLSYDDIYASAVPATQKIFTFDEARSLIIETLKPLGVQYEKALAEGFKNRWLDIYPNKGKRSGAYSSGSLYDGHPYILMNFNGTFGTVTTLAHEIGHALHSYFSNKAQPYPTADYPTFLAEIASTFNEALLADYLLKTEHDDLIKLFILDKYIEELRGTLFRQTLFADFELAVHREVEKGKTLTPGWLNANYLEITRLYYGHDKGVMDVDRFIENEWSAIPHFYYNFYVFQYSTGIAAATTLADMVLNGGETEKNRYLDFLKAGGSDYPLAVLAKAGVDLTTPAPILAALKKIGELTERMEKIILKIPG